MTPPLTPRLALEYLGELSTDIRAAVVLDADGALLAGDPALADPARSLVHAAGATGVEVATGEEAVFAARSPRHSIVVVAGRLALPALVLHDLRAVLADLEAGA